MMEKVSASICVCMATVNPEFTYASRFFIKKTVHSLELHFFKDEKEKTLSCPLCKHKQRFDVKNHYSDLHRPNVICMG